MYRGRRASRIWLGSCSNTMEPSKGATSVCTDSRSTAKLPSLEVSLNTSSLAASTHTPLMEHTSPSGVRGSRVCTVGVEEMRDTNLVYSSSTLSTSSDTKEE